MADKNAAVAIYETHAAAEAGVKELQRSGFNMKTLSIVGRDTHTEEHVVGYYNTGDKMKAWGKRGAFWGGLWGLLFGAAFFVIPGVGPLVLAGPIVSWIVGALEGATIAGGLSVLGAALSNMGVPRDSVLRYETAIKTDKFLLVVHGTAEEANRAKQILDATNPSQLAVHGG